MKGIHTEAAIQYPLAYEGDWHIDHSNDSENPSLAFAETINMGSLIFRGELSTESEHREKSAIARIAPINTKTIKSLSLTVRGDGRSYNLILKSSAFHRAGIRYYQPFQTIAGKMQRITLDMEQFLPKAFGQDQCHVPPLFLQNIDIDTIGSRLPTTNPVVFLSTFTPLPSTASNSGSAENRFRMKSPLNWNAQWLKAPSDHQWGCPQLLQPVYPYHRLCPHKVEVNPTQKQTPAAEANPLVDTRCDLICTEGVDFTLRHR